MRRPHRYPERVTPFDELSIHEKVKVRVCRATTGGGQCACWDGSHQRRKPACSSLDDVVGRIVDDVRRDVYRRREEGEGG